MASVEVESAANTMPQKDVEIIPELAPTEAEPIVAAPPAPEPVVEQLKAEATQEVPAEVAEETTSEVEEPKAETTQEEVKTTDQEALVIKEETLETTDQAVPEETPVTKEAVPEDTPSTEEAKESVEEEEKPAEVVATTEVATKE